MGERARNMLAKLLELLNDPVPIIFPGEIQPKQLPLCLLNIQPELLISKSKLFENENYLR